MLDRHELEISVISDSATHTMGVFLESYLDIKIHDLIREYTGKTIVVRGKHDRSKGISSNEKQGKLFNWKRPTAEISNNGILYINCFPGVDYIHHYAAIISSYIAMHHSDIQVVIEPPSKNACLQALFETNILDLPECHIVILGTVEKLTSVTAYQPWQGEGDFCWSVGTIGGKKIALLGCKFSIWGDIAGCLVRILSRLGVEEIIYTGKVGGLQAHMEPNLTIATGTESLWQGEIVTWESMLYLPSNPKMSVVCGKHVTVPSILNETKRWVQTLNKDYCFVDPEIGWMAKAAKDSNMQFGYLHIVSDNVIDMRNENLSNERTQIVLEKRTNSFLQLAELLKFNLLLKYSIQSCISPKNSISANYLLQNVHYLKAPSKKTFHNSSIESSELLSESKQNDKVNGHHLGLRANSLFKPTHKNRAHLIEQSSVTRNNSKSICNHLPQSAPAGRFALMKRVERNFL